MQPKRTFTVVLAIVSLLLATASFAQQRQPLPTKRTDAPVTPTAAEKPTVSETGSPDTSAVPKASTFIGSSVVNHQGENLGKIEDLVIDPIAGHINYAVLSYGSILGLGGKLFAISWDTLEPVPGEETFILNISQKALENWPGFDKDNWPKRPDPVLSAAARKDMGESMQSKGSIPENAVSATVQEVNVQAETVTLKTKRDETIQLQAPSEMLMGLQTGDAVAVKMSGKQATEIRKTEPAQQPSPGAKQQPQQ